MKVKCLIVDDEVPAHRVIESHLAKMDRFELVGHCYTGLEAYQLLREQTVDLLFLDIDMPELNGLELLRSLPKCPLVILTTAHAEYALESYEFDVVDYLLKPVAFPRFIKALGKVAERLSLSVPEPPLTHLTIKADGMPRRLEVKEILYLEGLGNYVKVHCPNKIWVVLQTLQQFEEQLQSLTQFCRVHKSYLVNLDHVQYLHAQTLEITNRQRVPLGRKYAGLVESVLRSRKSQ